MLSAGLALLAFGAVGCASDEPAETPPPSESAATIAPDASPDPDRSITWTVKGAADWPKGLVPAAKVYVAKFSALDKMDLYPPEVADTADGTTWAVFEVGVPDRPDYEHLVVVMKRLPVSGWVGVNLGTGMSRSEVLPPELLEGDFGTPPLRDR